MFDRLLEELRSTGISFKEGGWSTSPGTDYGAALLDGSAETVWADDAMQEQALSGSVHLFTRDAGRNQMLCVQSALSRAGVSWRLNSIQYEEDTRLTHYEWVFELETM